MPMTSETKLTKNEESESVDNTKYRGMIGSRLVDPTLRLVFVYMLVFKKIPKQSILKP